MSTMSVYDQLVAVMSQPPDCRLHFQLDNLLPWFRKHVSLFANMKAEAVIDVMKNVRFVTKQPNEIIIRQGDHGDCMYVVLRGKVTVYIQYAKSDGNDANTASAVPTNRRKSSISAAAAAAASTAAAATSVSDTLRHQLGTFVTHIGPGSQFGEVALLSDEARTASIIADEWTQLLVVDRDLYTRSVRDVLRRDFDDKLRFITEHRHFASMAPRFRKQLAMAMELRRAVPYDTVLTRQGDAVDSIYFVLEGELKVVMDADQHLTQYPKLMRRVAATHADGDFYNEYVVANHLDQKSSHHRRRRSPVNVCLLGTNKSIGDVEVILGLKTYAETTVCCKPTDVLQLELKHYERLFARRNTRCVDGMLADAAFSLRSRRHDPRLPIFRALLDVIEHRQGAADGQSVGPRSATRRRQRPRPADWHPVPARTAASIDVLRSLGRPTADMTSSPRRPAPFAGASITGRHVADSKQNGGDVTSSTQRYVDYAPAVCRPEKQKFRLPCVRDDDQDIDSDDVLPTSLDADDEEAQVADLEDRIHKWMSEIRADDDRPHIIPFHRCVTPTSSRLHPGSTAILRLRRSSSHLMQNNTVVDVLGHTRDGHVLDKYRLDNYRLALTADIPVFDDVGRLAINPPLNHTATA